MQRDWLLVNYAETCGRGLHLWVTDGGRHCDRYDRGLPCSRPLSSQPVFRCTACGDYDYGEPGGPGWEACEECARAAA